MKKPKDTKRRKKRRVRGAASATAVAPRGPSGTGPAGAAALALAEASVPVGEEGVFLRFGRLPKGGRSRVHPVGRFEAGVSVFPGRRMRKGKGHGVEYAVDVPLYLPTELLARQSRTVMALAANLRPVYVVAAGDGLEEVGTGGDGEPLLGGELRARAVPPFVRVGLPGWWGPEGASFAAAWNGARRGLGRGTQIVRDEAAPGSLQARVPRLWEAVLAEIGRLKGETWT